MADNQNKNNGGNGNRPGVNYTLVIIMIACILALVFWMQFNRFRSAGELEVSYDEFLEEVEEGKVSEAEIHSDKIYFKKKSKTHIADSIRYYVVRTDDYNLVDRLQKGGVKFREVDEGGNAFLQEVLVYVVVLAVMYVLISLLMRRAMGGSGVMNVGKSTAKMYGMQKNTGVTFKDVAGEEEAKEQLREMVDFLKQPQKYQEIGARLPKGALLVGPPGTGKTLLAKAVAGEAGVPFFSMSGSEFVEMYVGVGASRVRDLFRQANAKAPCIIFIDEIDAIGRSRDTRHMGGDSEREQTLNQLLSEMDGFDSSRGIIVLAATNRPEVLDKALLRPGRFDRRIIVERPDQRGREQILKVHSKNVRMDDTVDLHALAFATSGSVGADLANIINEAALTAVRKGRKAVSQNDLLEAVETVFAGKEKKDRILNKEEKSIVAYHESGHALLTLLQKHTMPVQKITIIPRTKGSLGYVWQTPEEERFLETKAEMEAHIVIAMGGRAAEALKFPSVTSGASNDIEQATDEARKMVTMYGMSDKFGMVQLEGITGEYLDRRSQQLCAEETAYKVDNEVRRIIQRAYNKAYRILKENIDILDAVAAYLIEHETITGKEFVSIYEKFTGEKVETPEEAKKKTDSYTVPKGVIGEAGKDGGRKRKKEEPRHRVYASEEYLAYRDTAMQKTASRQQGTSLTRTLEAEKKEQEEKKKESEKMVMPWEKFENDRKSDESRNDGEAQVTESPKDSGEAGADGSGKDGKTE